MTLQHSASRQLAIVPLGTYDSEVKIRKNRFPPGWDRERVRRVLEHYESQTDEEAVAEDEAAYEETTVTTMSVPVDLVPAVRELIAKQDSKSGAQ